MIDQLSAGESDSQIYKLQLKSSSWSAKMPDGAC